MDKKAQQYCTFCKQVTTQVYDSASTGWKCLCCESAKTRSLEATKQIASKKKRV